LREALGSVADVEQIAVYSQVDAAAVDLGAVFRDGPIDYITVTSSNIARALLAKLLGDGLGRIRSGATRLVSISPVTTAAVKQLGLPVAAEATTYTMEGVIAALVGLARAEKV